MFLAYHAYIYLLLLLPYSQRTAIQPRSRYFDSEHPLRDLRNVEWNISWVLVILRFAIAKCVRWCNDKQWYDCFLIYLITHNIPPVFAVKAWYSQRPLPCLHCFWKFWNRFWYQLKEMFLINHQYVRSYVSFLKKLWHTLKQIWIMPLHQGHCLTCIYSCINFYCPKVRRSWVIVA